MAGGSTPPCFQKWASSVSTTASTSTGAIWLRVTGWRLSSTCSTASTLPSAAYTIERSASGGRTTWPLRIWADPAAAATAARVATPAPSTRTRVVSAVAAAMAMSRTTSR